MSAAKTQDSFSVRLIRVGLYATLCMGVCVAAQPLKVGSGDKNIKAEVVLAGDHHYPPFHFLDDQNNPTGFDVELFRAIAKRKSLAVDIQLGNWVSKLNQLEVGKVDVIPMFVSEERERRYLFTKPFLTRYHLIFSHAHSKYLPSLEELKGQRVAVQYGGLAWEALRAASEESVIIPVNNEAEALVTLARGEADYALVPMTIGYAAILQNKLKGISAVSPPLLQRDYAFAVTPLKPDLVKIINEALIEVRLSGEQDKLHMEWLANLTSPKESYRSGMQTGLWIAVPLLFCTFLTFWWWRQAKYSAAREADRANKEAESRQVAEAQALHLAFHDAVTGLPNRNGFNRDISLTLNEMHRGALVRLDLLGLDMIYAVAGQSISQSVLKAVAERLANTYGNDCVADLSQGKFTVNLKGASDVYEATKEAKALISLINERYQISELPIDIRCRAGIALFPQHAQNCEDLFRAAELACLAAHESGQPWRLFEHSLMPDTRNLTLLADLQDAISDGTLGYALQPQIDLSTWKITGAELLVRWNHPRFGPLPPDVFVPLAEKTGSISQMTMYLVQKAIKDCREWRQKGINISLSINVSGNDLADELLVKAIIDQSEDVSDLLILEVTETEVMRDAERVLASVDKLRRNGIRISLDDFGTGYSSFSYLQRLNPDELKIDRTFVTKLSASPSDQFIVKSIIDLAHQLNAKVVAEGIEEASSLGYLKEHGCDIGQGYFLARPMSVEEFLSRTDLIS